MSFLIRCLVALGMAGYGVNCSWMTIAWLMGDLGFETVAGAWSAFTCLVCVWLVARELPKGGEE